MERAHIRHYLRHGVLPQLAVLEAAVRLGSITRAADELSLAQPTASLQLRKLAETMGAPLFEYTAGRARPTAAGARVHAACVDLFARLHALQDDLDALRRGEGVRLRLAVTSTADRFAARLLSAFVARHPGADVRLEVRNRQKLLERLHRNDDDVYLFANPPGGGDVVRQAILPNALIAIVAANSPLAARDGVAFAELASEHLLMREPGSGTRERVESLFQHHGRCPNVRMVLNTTGAIRDAVAAGLGVALLPRQALDPWPRPGTHDVAVVEVHDIADEGYWYLVHPAAQALSSVAEAFIAFARLEAANLAASPESCRRPAPTVESPR
ncbi:MAG: LysR family transcriptional regulator, partial [Casimicrobiaceae bacterium]